VRIVAGKWKGRVIAAPRGDDVRPTADKVREAWMSIVQPRIAGARVLDLFAGSGALGLEALSRGAASCLFVEQDSEALRARRGNVTTLGARAEIRAASVLALGPARVPLDLLLLDPPYGSGAGVVALERLLRLGWLAPASWVSLELGPRETPAVRGFELVAERRVGKALLALLRPEP
jgi:16S rRNA (guanine966-N2)-methyltransferase